MMTQCDNRPLFLFFQSRGARGFILLICLFFMVMSCRDAYTPPLDHIGDSDVRRILEKSIESSGGWKNWITLQRISYQKKTILYDEEGRVETEMDQIHKYVLQPELKGTITWRDSVGVHEILYSTEVAARALNGRYVEDSEASAREVFLEAFLVLFQPYKLLDPGVKLSYLGTEILEPGIEADAIMAEYFSGEQESHSTGDTWYYYFDKDTGKILASMVYQAPTYAFSENIETTAEWPLLMNTYRESYRMDSLRNKRFLRGTFSYSDYQMTFEE